MFAAGRPLYVSNECLNWQDNLDVQKLLDIISSIIADEYIEIAKMNPDIFTPHPSPLPKGERELTDGKK